MELSAITSSVHGLHNFQMKTGFKKMDWGGRKYWQRRIAILIWRIAMLLPSLIRCTLTFSGVVGGC